MNSAKRNISHQKAKKNASVISISNVQRMTSGNFGNADKQQGQVHSFLPSPKQSDLKSVLSE